MQILNSRCSFWILKSNYYKSINIEESWGYSQKLRFIVLLWIIGSGYFTADHKTYHVTRQSLSLSYPKRLNVDKLISHKSQDKLDIIIELHFLWIPPADIPSPCLWSSTLPLVKNWIPLKLYLINYSLFKIFI